MQTASSLCGRCGAKLSADVKSEICPACLLETGLVLLKAQFLAGLPDAGRDNSEPAEKTAGEDDPVADSLGSHEDCFGVYRIERHEDGSLFELGRGAMGVTYRALDTSLRRKVALKVIKGQVARRSGDARERFLREARAAASLRHENIATVYQFGIREDTGEYFYAMEWIEGETLEEHIQRAGPLDVRATVDIAQQVTAALVVAENHGLVHRDLKPANLMLVSPDREAADADRVESSSATQRSSNNAARLAVSSSRRRTGKKREKLLVKIIDFGLAKALHTQTDPVSLTRGGFVGTPEFASPEQFEHTALDVRSDIYSLGATLWFALTAKMPFAGRRIDEIHKAQQVHTLPTEQLTAAHVPSGLKSLLTSMLAFEPASRPGTHELAARLQRCSPDVRHVRHIRAAVAATILLMAGVSAFLGYIALHPHGSASQLGTPEKTIAVLPFENLSEEGKNAFFADGVQDEILSDLAKIADLKVISRASTRQYKSGVPRNLRKIGRELGVAHLVEGTVQRAGNRVRVNAQLIDARADRQMWGESYDRDLADVFAIQSEIAEQIVSQLKSKLSPREKAAIDVRPTQDIEAFDLYLQAKQLINTFHEMPDWKETLLKAVRLLDRAISRDPNFVLAYCWAARASQALYWFDFDHTPARLTKAKTMAEKALTLDPDSGEAHLAQAWVYYHGDRDYPRARAELAIARETLPNSADVYSLTGYIDRRQGKWEDAVKNLEKAAELDPRNSQLLGELSALYGVLRRYDDEEAVYDRAIAANPESKPYFQMLRAEVKLVQGDTKSARTLLDSLPAGYDTDGAVTSTRVNLGLYERDPASAAKVLDASKLEEFATTAGVLVPREWFEGLVARAGGDALKAREAFATARAKTEVKLRDRPNDGGLVAFVGLIDAGLGRRDEALAEGLRAIELQPIGKDALNGARTIGKLAMIYAWLGDRDAAIERLTFLAKTPGGPDYGQLKLDPAWDALRGDARFAKIVERLTPRSAQR